MLATYELKYLVLVAYQEDQQSLPRLPSISLLVKKYVKLFVVSFLILQHSANKLNYKSSVTVNEWTDIKNKIKN